MDHFPAPDTPAGPPPDEGQDAPPLDCPHCGATVPPDTAPEHGLLQCPTCGEQFFAPEVPDALPADSLGEGDPDAASNPGADPAVELDGLRIRQLSALRRGAYRSRSYAVIGAGACAVAGVKLALMAWHDFRAAGLGKWPLTFSMAALVLLALCAYFVARIVEWSRELRRSALEALPQPPAEPDFTTLSDGSQHWKNLDRIRE